MNKNSLAIKIIAGVIIALLLIPIVASLVGALIAL